MLVSRNLA